MAFSIPLFDLHVGAAEEHALLSVLRSKWISMGERTTAFERWFAEHLRADHVVAVANGTAALHLAMVVLGVGPGDEVIVPSLTFVATANAARYVGATPVFADVAGPTDPSLDPADVAQRITARTKAIVVVHYAGFAANMRPLMTLAARRGLFVVEDAAHAPDAEHEGRALGTIGDIGCFSFFSNKNITCAEGGALVARRAVHADRVRLLRSHGMTTMSYERARGHATDYDVQELGYNYRLDDLRAAMLLAQCRRLESDTSRRAALVGEYRRRLATIEELIVPVERPSSRASFHIMPVVIRRGTADREAVRAHLRQCGIQTTVHYPPIHRFGSYRQYGADVPRTNWIADHEITLPLYPAMRPRQIRTIVDALADALIAGRTGGNRRPMRRRRAPSPAQPQVTMG